LLGWTLPPEGVPLVLSVEALVLGDLLVEEESIKEVASRVYSPYSYEAEQFLVEP